MGIFPWLFWFSHTWTFSLRSGVWGCTNTTVKKIPKKGSKWLLWWNVFERHSGGKKLPLLPPSLPPPPPSSSLLTSHNCGSPLARIVLSLILIDQTHSLFYFLIFELWLKSMNWALRLLLLLLLLLVVFLPWGSLCILVCPGTHFIDKAGLRLTQI